MNKQKARQIAYAIAADVLEERLRWKRAEGYGDFTNTELAEARKIDPELDKIVARLKRVGDRAYEGEE